MVRIVAVVLLAGILLILSIGCYNPFELPDVNLTITGRVIDPKGKPVEDAIVRTDPITTIDKTNSSGVYIIIGAPPGKYKLKASKPGYKPSEYEIEAITNRFACQIGKITKDIVLEEQAEGEKTGEIYGTVKDEDSKVISGATITTEPITTEIRTDTNGIFVIADVKPGTYKVKGQKEGYPEAIKESVVVEGGKRTQITIYSIIPEEYVFITKWGSGGTGDGQFYSPIGIAVDGSGNVYVVDYYNSRIQKFTSDGTFITKWGSKGSGDGQFFYPSEVAVDSSGYVYVADGRNDRIQKFTPDGTFITKWGSGGTGDGQLYYPNGVAVDGFGYVYVADGRNDRIQKFTPDGTFVTKWGSEGTGDGQFYSPGGIAVDNSGNVYVVDQNNNRIQKFTSDGTFITKWVMLGSDDGRFYLPVAVAVNSSGNVFVVDHGKHRIQEFTSDGTFVTKWASRGSGDGQIDRPSGVAVDSSGNVYVADTGNDRIQKFRRK